MRIVAVHQLAMVRPTPPAASYRLLHGPCERHNPSTSRGPVALLPRPSSLHNFSVAVTSPSARPANELRQQDFQAATFWRFVTPDEMENLGVDESCVRPEPHPPAAGQYGSFLVAAHYTLKGGAVLPGVVQVDLLGSQIECTPAVVFACGKGVDPLGHDTARRLQRLLKTAAVQPVAWRLIVPLGDETSVRSGSISKPGLWQTLGLLAQLARLKRAR